MKKIKNLILISFLSVGLFRICALAQEKPTNQTKKDVIFNDRDLNSISLNFECKEFNKNFNDDSKREILSLEKDVFAAVFFKKICKMAGVENPNLANLAWINSVNKTVTLELSCKKSNDALNYIFEVKKSHNEFNRQDLKKVLNFIKSKTKEEIQKIVFNILSDEEGLKKAVLEVVEEFEKIYANNVKTLEKLAKFDGESVELKKEFLHSKQLKQHYEKYKKGAINSAEKLNIKCQKLYDDVLKDKNFLKMQKDMLKYQHKEYNGRLEVIKKEKEVFVNGSAKKMKNFPKDCILKEIYLNHTKKLKEEDNKIKFSGELIK